MPYPLLEPFAKYGHFGVELFFLISGFVILMTASNGSLKQFLISRIVRLYPAFWVCCTLTFLAILMFGDSKYSATFTQYLSNMTMLSSFGFMQKIAAAPYLDGSYWSLAVELRFYGFVALVLLLRQIHRAELFISCWLLATIAVEFLHLTHFRGLLIVDYSAYFIGGAMFFKIWSQGFSKLRITVVLGAWIMALYQAYLALPKYEETFNTHMNSIYVLAILSAFFGFIALIAGKRTGWLGRRSWASLGSLTYPLYLLHQVIGYLIINRTYPHFNPHAIFWGTLALMLAAAYLINKQVEQRYATPFKELLTGGWDSSNALLSRWRDSSALN